MTLKSYKELTVWQKSVDLSVFTYKISEWFPKSELYGLTSQIRRCCVAIASNIAEGQMRGHKQEYMQFLRIAYSSGGELETQILIAFRIGYLKQSDYEKLNNLLGEILRMLNALINVLIKPRT